MTITVGINAAPVDRIPPPFASKPWTYSTLATAKALRAATDVSPYETCMTSSMT
ncbi:MAG TPA: hypothetical protein VK659_28680 [Asanoa sp.]|nr:hypothetical protein [Asanoa sp.]